MVRDGLRPLTMSEGLILWRPKAVSKDEEPHSGVSKDAVP